MTVLNRLATALKRRDEIPNQELAQAIVRKRDSTAITELVDNLSNKNKNIQADCIKVLYEIGESKPSLISAYYREFGALLESRNNRLVWGAMTALDMIALVEPKAVYELLPRILAVANSGSVISRDHAVGILAKLGTLVQYADQCVPLLIEQLMACPNNQFPMYAEMSVEVVTGKNDIAFKNAISKRMNGLEKESQRKRVAKVLKRLERTFPSTGRA